MENCKGLSPRGGSLTAAGAVANSLQTTVSCTFEPAWRQKLYRVRFCVGLSPRGGSLTAAGAAADFVQTTRAEKATEA
jgi:hypothetical protein